jgi:type I restriction-modification system DNA methylase subunit
MVLPWVLNRSCGRQRTRCTTTWTRQSTSTSSSAWFLFKYISDAFEAKHAELEAQKAQGADPEDPDEYAAARIFWVPKGARWAFLRANAPQPKIGTIIDDAMGDIERDNPSLKGVLPRDFARVGLDKQRLGQLINLVSDIGLGSPADRAKDVLGRVYEYFLAQFASAEGKKGGQFYTPSRVVRVLVEVAVDGNVANLATASVPSRTSIMRSARLFRGPCSPAKW